MDGVVAWLDFGIWNLWATGCALMLAYLPPASNGYEADNQRRHKKPGEVPDAQPDVGAPLPGCNLIPGGIIRFGVHLLQVALHQFFKIRGCKWFIFHKNSC